MLKNYLCYKVFPVKAEIDKFMDNYDPEEQIYNWDFADIISELISADTGYNIVFDGDDNKYKLPDLFPGFDFDGPNPIVGNLSECIYNTLLMYFYLDSEDY